MTWRTVSRSLWPELATGQGPAYETLPGKPREAVFTRLCDELSVAKGDIEVAIGAVSNAKNKLAKVSGYSPGQHVFGYSPNDPDGFLNGPHAGDPGDEAIIDDRHAREVAVRHAARAAYYHVQSDDRVRRALAGRTRVTSRPPKCGERVFYYRKTKNNKRGVWLGLGTVIGYEGVNAWVTRGGRCVLCAPEHLRLATPMELGQAFSLRAARDDLDRLLNLDEEAEAFEEDDGGGVGQIDFDSDFEMGGTEQGAELEHGEPSERGQGVRRGLARPVPVVMKRQRRKGKAEHAQAEHAQDVMMMKKARTERSREKALEKEIPWELIPEEVRPRFRAAEGKQWAEHVDNHAIEVLSVTESERVRATVTCQPNSEFEVRLQGQAHGTSKSRSYCGLEAKVPASHRRTPRSRRREQQHPTPTPPPWLALPC